MGFEGLGSPGLEHGRVQFVSYPVTGGEMLGVHIMLQASNLATVDDREVSFPSACLAIEEVLAIKEL